MNRQAAEKVADALLYEGYILYPYRRSALKNRQRWMFGILYPPEYQEVCAGTERATMHSECLLRAGVDCKLEVRLRFLQARVSPQDSESEGRTGERVESCEECEERRIDLNMAVAHGSTAHIEFSFPGNGGGAPGENIAGTRCTVARHEIRGAIAVTAQTAGNKAFRLLIDVTNQSSMPEGVRNRDKALLQSLISAHLLLTVPGGEFVSLLDPPPEFQAAAAGCRNIGNFPVLAGEPEQRDMLLCSPILLYDYPQIAPESAGDFYDATEMDEMLTLRVMTLTDQEKNEIRRSDEHARNLLHRTEETAREQLQKTHGAIRSMRSLGEDHE